MSLKSQEHNSQQQLQYESDDFGMRNNNGSPSFQQRSARLSQLDSPTTIEQIHINLKEEIKARKEKNEANQQLQKFKKCLQKQDVGNSITTSSEKISMIPGNLREDLQEAVLYAYFAVRYYDEHIFKVIQTRTSQFQNDRNLHQLIGKERSFQQLTVDNSYSRFRFNQLAFEIAIDKDYIDVAFHFIETGQVHITWEMVRKMLHRRQEYLVKQCIKYGSKFDAGSSSLKKIIFAGRTAAPLEDRAIKLVDFIQVMLELRWKSRDIKEVLVNYSKKGKIDVIDMRELFLMFAVKRKLKLMSMMINGEQFGMEFQEENFVDVIENDAYDMAVLLYREYFLDIKIHQEKIINLLVNSFTKTNGLLEAKCFLIKKFFVRMSFEQATKLLEAVEARVNDSSKGNILILTLNVIKATCLLLELAEQVRSHFSFLNRRVQEIRAKLVRIANLFMQDIQTEEEMRFYLLEKDLDERDSLNIIYDYQVIELLENPFTQNIVRQIWCSQYNNSHSLFAVSSVHRLLLNYNHCRFDEEEQLRFYKPRNLNKIGCHGFQFQVWRYSGESRHLVASVTTLAFVIILHILFTRQMSRSHDFWENNHSYQYWKGMYNEQFNAKVTLSAEQVALRSAMYKQQNLRMYDFQLDCMQLCFLFHCSWMYLFQHGYNVVFAFKNKRTPHLIDPGNFMDWLMFVISLLYIFSAYKGWRYNTFLEDITPEQLGERYWQNYITSPINENAVLLIYGILMWLKVFYQLKLIRISGSIFALAEKMVLQMFTFAIFYFSILFLYSVVGVVLFNDIGEFSEIKNAMFTLFKATIQDYNADLMQNARIGSFLGYCYFLSYMILNLILIVNLIVARLANTFKQYNKKRDLLMLLNTLFVREVSEADDKYSAVVSAPFPLNMFQFTLGSLVISLKSPAANIALLNLYYLPISIISTVTFFAYQIVLLPLCYLKLIGHKFALMVKSPQGQGARTTLDRAGHAVLFILIGPILLSFNVIVDMYWFLRHLYKMDLDKSHLQGQQTIDIHRRTYKKMIKYFEQKNEQLVPQKKVAEDLRQYLDVMEGIRCMVYGRPKEIPQDKLGLYIAYAKGFIKESQEKRNKYELKDEGLDEKIEIVEQVASEFNVVKQVLLNNSIPVDMREIQQTNVKKKGWGMRILFDKKTFYALLLDLERMRKVLNVKKAFYIFHIPYEGKPKEMNSWHKKVELRVTQTLKFLNTARLLKIIGYDPVYHIKMEQINLAMGTDSQAMKMQLHDDNDSPIQKKQSLPVKGGFSSSYREDNLQANFQFMINKYANTARQVKDLADILKKLNHNNDQLQQMQGQFLNNGSAAKGGKQSIQNSQAKLYQDFGSKPVVGNGKQMLDVSFQQENNDVNFDSQKYQKQVNYYSPSKYGVINQQPSVSERSDKVKKGGGKQKWQDKADHQQSERSQSEAVLSSDEDSQDKKFGKDESHFSGLKTKKQK